MNVQPITISEFRKNTKVILDQAKTRVIYLARGWEVYRVEYMGGSTLSLPDEVQDKLKTMPKRKDFAKLKAEHDVRTDNNPNWGA